MSQVNITTIPLIASGGTPFVGADEVVAYRYQIINDEDTTISATIDTSNNLVVDATNISTGSYKVKVS